MIMVALIGSEGTGKTTVFREIQKTRPNWVYFSEPTRRTIPRIGYADPWVLIEEVGIAFYESLMLSQWCVLDREANPTISSADVIVLDRCPADNLAYYFMERTQDEQRFEHIFVSLCKHYVNLIDNFFFFPSGVFPCHTDGLRRPSSQQSFECELLKALSLLGVVPIAIQQTCVSHRVKEIVDAIDAMKKGN